MLVGSPSHLIPVPKVSIQLIHVTMILFYQLPAPEGSSQMITAARIPWSQTTYLPTYSWGLRPAELLCEDPLLSKLSKARWKYPLLNPALSSGTDAVSDLLRTTHKHQVSWSGVSSCSLPPSPQGSISPKIPLRSLNLLTTQCTPVPGEIINTRPSYCYVLFSHN